MSPRLRGALYALYPLAIIAIWAAIIVGVGYWQQQQKQNRGAEPTLVHTGIEKRAKIVTDTYEPLSTQYRDLTRCYGQPPKGGVKCDPLPRERPTVTTCPPHCNELLKTPPKKAAVAKPVKPMKMSERVARCTSDAIRLCAAALPNRDKIIACLQSKRAQLSTRCAPVFATPVPITKPTLDANGHGAAPLKASKTPCDVSKSKKSSNTYKPKSHRTLTPGIIAPEEYHDGASQWSRDHPGPIPNLGTSGPDLGSGHGGHSHAGGHHHHSPPPHHTLC
jgi:hypothetical protein